MCLRCWPLWLMLVLAVPAYVISAAFMDWLQHGSPLLRNRTLPELVVQYTSLTAAALVLVGRDWSNLGPGMALRNGGVAAVLAWFFAVPLGVLSELAIEALCWLLVVGLTGLISYAVFGLGEYFGVEGQKATPFACLAWWLLTLLAVVLATQGGAALLTRWFGTSVVFALVYLSARSLLQLVKAKVSPIETWAGLEALSHSSREFQELRDEFDAGCLAWAHKYHHGLKVVDIHRVARPPPAQGEQRLVRTDNGMPLYHGTSPEAVQSILGEGFRLPPHSGMFGYGIYFADCPLKCYRYAQKSFYSFVSGRALVLRCWVELGRQRHEKRAKSQLRAPPGRNIFQWLRREPKYTSVVGDPEERGGALRVPEYIIYDPSNAEVDYIFVVDWAAPVS